MSETQGLASQGIGGKLKELGVILTNGARDKSVDIRGIVSDITIYENIFNQTLHGVATVIDAIGFLSGYGPFQMVGEEYLTLTYAIADEKKPQRSLTFFVHNIAMIHNAENLKHKRYLISFCSEEHVIDAAHTIQQAYKQPYSETVKSILDEHLESKKTIEIQETKGVQPFIVPRLSPLEAIDMIRRRSIASTKFTGASYLFFETTTGFKFCDIENLIEKGREKAKSDKETYTYAITEGVLQRPVDEAETADSNDPRNYNKQEFKTLFAFTQSHKVDTIEKIKKGMFQSEAVIFDPVKVRITTEKFKFDPKKTTALGNESETSSKFIEKLTGENKTAVAHFIAKDSSTPDNYLNEVYGPRASYMTRLAQNMFTANIIGDPALQAGDVITVPSMPAFRDPDGLGNSDKLLSGEFLVAGIIHKFGQETYVAELELYKNGYAAKVEESIWHEESQSSAKSSNEEPANRRKEISSPQVPVTRPPPEASLGAGALDFSDSNQSGLVTII